MLSRFALIGGHSLKKSVVNFQPISAITTSAVNYSDNVVKKDNVSPSNIPPEYPPPTSKRDHVNYPRPVMRETPPPVRFGFIPESWFTFFYPKTGYTGPYIFIASVGTYLFSKEKIVYDHNFTHLLAFIGALMFIHMKLGKKVIAPMYNKALEKEIQELDGVQEQEKQVVRDRISALEKLDTMPSAVAEVAKATTENIYLQMEMAYRQRLEDVYKEVKNKLDCQYELENVEKRILQRNLMDYVISNVMKSLTPDLEKNVLQKCISDLNALAAKA